MEGIIIYAHGLDCMSVCVDGKLTVGEVEEKANKEIPTGIESKWSVSGGDFRDGATNPCDCPEHPGRKHYLLTC